MADCKVFPSKPLPEQTIKLSICDAYSPKVWVCQIHFWPDDAKVTFERAHEVLKEALSRTLAEIPALAGTVARLSEDPRDLCVRVDSDAHVELAMADLTNEDVPSYTDLKDAGFPMTTELSAIFSQPVTLVPIFEGSRMFTAKLNRLRGGLALSFGFNHLLTDGAAIAEIERIWSCHANDISNGNMQEHKPHLPDVEIRKRLSIPPKDAGVLNDKFWKVFPAVASQLNLPREQIEKEPALADLERFRKAQPVALDGINDETKWCIWKFAVEDLARLKTNASGSEQSQWISTNDALVALFWSRLTNAKGKSEGYPETSLLVSPINIRQRLQPPIETQYIGNAVDIITPERPSLELADNERGLKTAAWCFRTAISRWKESKWASWLTVAAGLPAEEAICPDHMALLGPYNVGFNDYSKQRSNLLNWGSELGVIDCTRYMKPAASLANCATAVVVHPRLADGGLEVATTCTDAIRSALEADAVFREYGKFVCSFA